MSSTFTTSAMVKVDMRESRLRKHVRENMTCSICHGIAASRMICGHESEAMKKFVAQEETITRERLHVENSQGDAEMGGYWDIVVDDGIHENEGHPVIDIDYATTQSRNFSHLNQKTMH